MAIAISDSKTVEYHVFVKKETEVNGALAKLLDISIPDLLGSVRGFPNPDIIFYRSGSFLFFLSSIRLEVLKVVSLTNNRLQLLVVSVGNT